MLIEIANGRRQPPWFGDGVVVDEGEHIPLCSLSRSISSPSGITIGLDNVAQTVVRREVQPLRRYDNQLEIERRLLIENRSDGPLGIAADSFHGHDHRYSWGMRHAACGMSEFNGRMPHAAYRMPHIV